MTNNFTDGIKEELLARVAEFKDSFIEEQAHDFDEGVSACFDFLQYGIRNGNPSIIAAVYDLTYNDDVHNFVADILEELADKGIVR
ncbi:hypothetical protein BSP36_234 [Bacillus phage BSP36]|uniref:Uncharacterized protein n=1 Tax=Bacillus phage BSP38 TaxID=2283013 RepID=A0A345MKA3_BPBSP|nr:hypothetical protein HWB82_gp075 [Bacillus phage BSP38]AXH71285.1 hypothetical protein BSP38_243 [Bacillus phage BSP38]AYJ75321.1 hypothetical protein BSP36_234 [Bacillus phage BSP36]